MSTDQALELARSLMFEGYVLYPYRRSSLKNQKRMVFGSLYPATWSEQVGQRYAARTEVLARATRVSVCVLFLHWASRRDPEQAPWLEARERQVRLGPFELGSLARGAELVSFAFPREAWDADGARFEVEAVAGTLSVSAERAPHGAFKLRLTLHNRSSAPGLQGDDAPGLAERMSLGSAHLLVRALDGELISLLEPEEALREAAAACQHDGLWPVLVGDRGARDTLLASPITLYDFPTVAPESRGDYCDATEIDEMLALRVRTLTDAEKEQARRTDPRARQIVDRSEELRDEELASLHGAWREPAAATGEGPRPGDRVRLRPRPGRDILDLALDGELATVLSLEQDFEGRRYCTVTVDADPGRDLGQLGQPGHRFFFDLDELESAR